MSDSILDKDLLSSCVHCGLCLETCPTYQLSGDENNSPRGRLRLWREESSGALAPDRHTDFYTAECVGCLACESACPANVPYGKIFEQARRQHVETGRFHPKLELRAASISVKHPAFFNIASLPVRALRRIGIFPHPLVFPGRPAILESTSSYARRLMAQRRPTGPRVALLTGCLMEGVFREINFATVRVLIENNIQVIVPDGQGCCGAFQEHTGLGGADELHDRNRQAFRALDVDAIVSNSSGCGLALQRSLKGEKEYYDVLKFLEMTGLVRQLQPRQPKARVYVDQPCHLIHGQKSDGIPASILNATGYRWELAPRARDCCGSGGIYNIQKPENAREILKSKSAFLNEADGEPLILATSNHVCMMQWHSAGTFGLVRRPYQVRHVIQLLDPAVQHANM